MNHIATLYRWSGSVDVIVNTKASLFGVGGNDYNSGTIVYVIELPCITSAIPGTGLK